MARPRDRADREVSHTLFKPARRPLGSPRARGAEGAEGIGEVDFDTVIRNGRLFDGSGGPPVQADVGIRGERITAVGKFEGRAAREIDASGQIVTPGFVDIHAHLDAQIFWDGLATSACWHGITSVIMGNCGVTFAPC
ncbi:MAG: amidohydrolase family protein, partial [Deltaproteobacteria bacterium]|nr:amidohydrolase family protein [Deltaproteobacteria bacterium]